MEKKIKKAIYLDVDRRDKLDEIVLYRKRLGDKLSYGDIMSEGLDMLHDMVAADYFQEYKEEYPRWKKRWSK